MFKKAFLLTCTTLFLCLSAMAQQVNISGLVVDAKNKPLVGVAISIPHKTGVQSDKQGRYKLATEVKDSIVVEFKLIGYHTIDILVSPLDENMMLNVVLKEQEQLLDEVVVTAQKSQSGDYMHVDVFSPETKGYFLNRGVETMVTMMPGVSTTNDLSSQYQVRGGNFDENLVYINGVEVYRPLLVRSSKQEGISMINPDMVGNVAFSTGGFGAEYGDKASSVLDVQYKQPTRKVEGKIGASLLDGSVYLGNKLGRFSQMTTVRYKTTESMLKSSDTKAEYKPSFMDVQTLMSYQINTNWGIAFWGNYSDNTYKFTPKTRSTNFGTLSDVRNFKVHFDGWENDEFRTGQAALTLRGKIRDNLEMSLTGSIVDSREQERYDITGRYRLTESNGQDEGELLGVGSYHEHARNRLDVDIYRIEHAGKWTLDKHQIRWGLSLKSERFRDKIREWEMRDSTGYLLPNNGDDIEMYNYVKSKNNLNSIRVSGYLQDRYSLNTDIGYFALTGGVRFNYWNFNEDLIMSPRLYIRYIPSANDNLAFHLSGGLYYQTPFFKEYQAVRTDANGNNTVYLNENIKSEKSTQVIGGLDYSFGETRKFKFSTELYYKSISNLIPYTVDNLKIRYSGNNDGSGYIAGVDFRLYGELVPNTTSWISLALMKTQQKITGNTAPLPTDQQWMVSAYIEDYMPGYERLKLGFTGSFAQGIPFTVPNGELTDGYFRTSTFKKADIALSWQALGENYAIRKSNSLCGSFRNIWLGFEILNLFDIKNVNTHYWVSDVYSNYFAVPNYHTGRQFNVRLVAEF